MKVYSIFTVKTADVICTKGHKRLMCLIGLSWAIATFCGAENKVYRVQTPVCKLSWDYQAVIFHVLVIYSLIYACSRQIEGVAYQL